MTKELEIQHFTAYGLPAPVPEYQFAHPRKWRFDWSWPDKKVAVEIEGGAWTSGRHTRGVGYIADMEKYNTAIALGWRLFRFTPSQLRSGEAASFLRERGTLLNVEP
jgi:hypothetical protein